MTAETTEYDVIVVGSGAAGMTAALKAADTGLSVLVVEKAAHYGGSTARSGGGVWVPGNESLVKAGIKDTPTRRASTCTPSSATWCRRSGSTPTSTAAPRSSRWCTG